MAFPDYKGALNLGLPNGFASSRGGAKVKYLVVHVAAGYWDGTIAWFNDRRAQANSHYLAGLDGRIGQFVDEDWAAWANYPANEESVSIEHVDNLKNGSPGWMSEAQFAASTKLAADVLKRHGLGVAAIKRHNEVGNTSHNCPGPHFPLDRYKKRVSEILAGVSHAAPPKPTTKPATHPDFRVVVGSNKDRDGAELVKDLAVMRGFKNAWIMPTAKGDTFSVVVGAGERQFCESQRDLAVSRGFKNAWLLAGAVESKPAAGNTRPPAKPNIGDGSPPKKEGSQGSGLILPRPSNLHTPGSGAYVNAHPTKYTFRPDVRELVLKYLNHPKLKGKIWIVTYEDHPPGWGLDTTSFDVWDWEGRGVALSPYMLSVADEIIFNDPQGPRLWWRICKGWMWNDTEGFVRWDPPEDGSDAGHHKHGHYTFR